MSEKSINVVMCGGRRTGKTSIMAAIRSNIQDMFPEGTQIALQFADSGSTNVSNTLSLYQKELKARFDDADAEYFPTDLMPTTQRVDYECHVFLQGKNSHLDLNFIDVPGEWYTNPLYRDDLKNVLSDSDILLIAVDSPHLMEESGEYHNLFNRVEQITKAIKEAFDGNRDPKMVLFVPLKCEKYRKTANHKNRMENLLNAVREGYKDLIDGYLLNGENKRLYAVAVSPCFTLGGVEFLQFISPRDANGEPVPKVFTNPSDGLLYAGKAPRYAFLWNEWDEHYYEPKDCEQPLLYILLYLVAIGRRRGQGFFGIVKRLVGLLPPQKTLDATKNALFPKVKRNSEDGFSILNDPLYMMN